MIDQDFIAQLEMTSNEKLVEMLIGTTNRSSMAQEASEMVEANEDIKMIKAELMKRLG